MPDQHPQPTERQPSTPQITQIDLIVALQVRFERVALSADQVDDAPDSPTDTRPAARANASNTSL